MARFRTQTLTKQQLGSNERLNLDPRDITVYSVLVGGWTTLAEAVYPTRTRGERYRGRRKRPGVNVGSQGGRSSIIAIWSLLRNVSVRCIAFSTGKMPFESLHENNKKPAEA
jgi:hypothetical protein